LKNKEVAIRVEQVVKEILRLTRTVTTKEEKKEVTINYCESIGMNPKHFLKLMYE
jgi:hypothetical protein